MRQKLALALGSLIFSLAVAEWLADTVHQGAYPYLNLFQSDARYGVKLVASAATRVRSPKGRITEIRTNALGFRGPEWISSGAPPVLLLGDSQMFGFGVPYSQSTGAELERALEGTPVLCAAVPSLGPSEYVAAISDLASTFRPRDVIFVANAANDWFETVPNVRRTTARDGWAARAGTPPAKPFAFREFLLGRSHLVLAIRQLTHHFGESEALPAQSARFLARDVVKLRGSEAGARSSMTPWLRAAKQACAKFDCKVTAVALPLDVQVDASEWKKYRLAPEDLSATEALLEDFVDDAQALGLEAVNLLPVLRVAQPGAFLADDYHLSARGHRAVAAALADVLRKQRALAEVNR